MTLEARSITSLLIESGAHGGSYQGSSGLLVLFIGALQRLFLHRGGTCEKNTGGFTGVWYLVRDTSCGVSVEAERGREEG